MKRPRPVSSAESSTRGIDRPTHGAPGWGLAMTWLAASAIPDVLPRNSRASGESIQRRFGSGHAGRSRNLPSRLISRGLCGATSACEPGDLAKLTRAHADMVAEEAGEM